MMKKDPHRYDDIIHLPRFVSQGRKHMSMHDRAAQFAPFAALSGYDDSIRETARLTDTEAELSESALADLDRKLRIIADHIREKPLVTIRYFIEDEKKEGGRYENITFNAVSVDAVNRQLTAADKQRYQIDHIADIDSELIREEYGSEE